MVPKLAPLRWKHSKRMDESAASSRGDLEARSSQDVQNLRKSGISERVVEFCLSRFDWGRARLLGLSTLTRSHDP